MKISFKDQVVLKGFGTIVRNIIFNMFLHINIIFVILKHFFTIIKIFNKKIYFITYYYN